MRVLSTVNVEAGQPKASGTDATTGRCAIAAHPNGVNSYFGHYIGKTDKARTCVIAAHVLLNA